MTKFSAILATGRISNLPTVWCNVLVAFLLVQIAYLHDVDVYASAFSLPLFIATCIAASCLYVGGCFLGDAVDVEFDKKHKPERPIPSGVLSRSSIYTAAVTLLIAGSVIPTAYLNLRGDSLDISVLPHTIAITGAIIIYSLWHKRSPWIGLPFIGACRFFLIIWAAAVAHTFGPELSSADFVPLYSSDESYYFIATEEGLPIGVILYAFAVGIFTISFASVARSESSPKPITWRKALIAVMLLLPFLSIAPSIVEYIETSETQLNLYGHASFSISLITISSLLIYFIWMIIAFRKISTNKGKFVSMSLAGFCLLDACFAAAFGWQWLLVCLGLFALSLFLQKFAPAT